MTDTQKPINITIVGLGLMGGSAAIDLKKRGFANKIFGVDQDKINAKTALHIGFVDAILPLEEAVVQSEMIILAIPVNAAQKVLPKVLNLVTNQTIMDMCSTKGDLLKGIKDHPKRENFVATHPMAGTEFSGPWAAHSGLFDGKATIFCNVNESSQQALAMVNRLYASLYMRPIFMDSKNHDEHAAYVSHISHISSFALALTVLDKEKNEKHIFDLASGGFDSTVRLAKSSSEMWTPIFLHNKTNVLEVLNTYIDKLNHFRRALEESNEQSLVQLIKQSNEIKKVLN